jgi:hypothetical protein
VEHEGRADERRQIEVGRDERKPAQQPDRGGERHRFDPSSRTSLYSAASRGAGKDGAIINRLFDSQRVTRLAEQLLASPRFAQAVALAVQKGLETKGHIDRNLETLLGLLNLPSRADVKRLSTKLDAIQGSLVNLNLKLDRLLERRSPRRRRARRPRPPEPPPGELD